MGNRNSIDTRPQVPVNWTAKDISSQKDKVAIVTGANSGIGYETALELARNGANVVLACRNESRGKDAEQKIREALASTPEAGKVEFKMLDVSDLSSVNKFADEFKATHDRLDLLINNAGIFDVPYGKTVDGYERQFATNHLGHFALTAQLFPLLKGTNASRIVNVSSVLHTRAKLKRFTESTIMHSSEKDYDRSEAYAESKLCNLLFTFELDRRIRDQKLSGVTVVVSHPGLTGTEMINKWLWGVGAKLPLFQKPEMGALPTLYAATAADVKGADYYGPRKLFEIRGNPKRVEAKSTAHDETAARNLWTYSERLAKLKFDVE